MNKKLTCFFIVFSLISALLPCLAGAASYGDLTYESADGVNVTINGKALVFADQPPVIIDDRTLVPLRAIFEALGADVTWDDATRTVNAAREDVALRIKIDDMVLYKNEIPITLDVPAQLVNDRTLVPVRAISEAFDCKVDWDANTKTVIITGSLPEKDINDDDYIWLCSKVTCGDIACVQTYDEHGNMLSSARYYNNDPNGKEEYEYNENGECIKRKDGLWESSYSYEYDPDGNITKRTVSTSGGSYSDFVQYSPDKNKIIYEDSDSYTVETFEHGLTKTFTYRSSFTSAFDSDGNLVSEMFSRGRTIFEPDLQHENHYEHKYEYEYDDNGLLRTINIDVWKNDALEKEYFISYQYDEHGNIIKEQTNADFVNRAVRCFHEWICDIYPEDQVTDINYEYIPIKKSNLPIHWEMPEIIPFVPGWG